MGLLGGSVGGLFVGGLFVGGIGVPGATDVFGDWPEVLVGRVIMPEEVVVGEGVLVGVGVSSRLTGSRSISAM